jgi:hypothetical protein
LVVDADMTYNYKDISFRFNTQTISLLFCFFMLDNWPNRAH